MPRLFLAVEELLQRPWQRLVDLDLACAALMAEWLGLSARIERSSALGIAGERSERLVNICRHFGASTYVSGDAAASYLDVPLLDAHGIAVQWQGYVHPTYPQQHGEFVPYLSALDLLLNCGDESRRIAFAGLPIK